LKDILYSGTWAHHPENKIIVAREIVDQLVSYGFWWQARRVENHLYRWLKTQKTVVYNPGRVDTPLPEKGEGGAP